MNQRGQTEYTAAGYTIDRWYTNAYASGTVKVINGGIEVTCDSTLAQTLENPSFLEGETVTASILTTDGKLVSLTAQFSTSTNQTALIGGIHIHIGKFLTVTGVTIYSDKGTSQPLSALAAKLELGSVQTLAHKEGDKWVLNEVPSYAEQLARCQRYQLNLFDPTNTGESYVLQGIATNGMNIYGICPTPVTLAKHPTIVTDCSADAMYNTFGLNADKYQAIADVSGLKVFGKMEHGVILVATGSNFVAGNPYMIYIKATNTHKCLLDANL